MTTVVVPAHNEEQTIAACLRALLADAAPGEFGVIVACNGCGDATATRAKEVASEYAEFAIEVVNLSQPSKTEALNAAFDVATRGPVIVVDADVAVSTASIRSLIEALGQRDVRAASTTLHIDTAGASAIVRSYHRFWARLPAIVTGLSGRGVYALDEQGRARLGRFPSILGDDALVDRTFSASERFIVAATSTVQLSPDVRSLIGRKKRVFAGNDELASLIEDRRPSSSWTEVLRAEPSRIIDLPAYLAINATAKVLSRRGRRKGSIGWGHERSHHGEERG